MCHQVYNMVTLSNFGFAMLSDAKCVTPRVSDIGRIGYMDTDEGCCAMVGVVLSVGFKGLTLNCEAECVPQAHSEAECATESATWSDVKGV